MNNLKNSLLLQIQYLYKFHFTWFNPAIHDLKIKYRKTIFGPWWNVITNIIFITILSLLWSRIINLPIRDYMGHVYIGLIIWIYLNEIVNNSLILLTDKYSNYYKNYFIPVLTLNLRNVFLNFIIFLHNLPLIIIFMIFNSVEMKDYFLLFIGLVFLFINSFWLSIIITFFGTRYLDVKPLITGLMTLGTLVTPIMWKKEMLGEYSKLIYLNPVTHLIDIIRDPIINNSLNIYLILTNFIFSVIGFLVVFILLKFKGHRIIFWI